MLNPCASFAVFLGTLRSAWDTGLAPLWMLLPLGHSGWTAAGLLWGGPRECSPPCLHRGGVEKKSIPEARPHNIS